MNESTNKVKFGLKNVYIAKLIESEGKITYETPFHIPGAVNLSRNAEGDITKFKADNIIYFSSNSNQGYTGDLEIALVVEQFLTDILGQTKDKNGALIENADDTISRFALMFEVIGDAKNRRNVYYDCIAKRPETEAKTLEESKTPDTEKLSLTMNPRSTDGMVKASIEPTDANKTIYESFFKQVYEKDATASV